MRPFQLSLAIRDLIDREGGWSNEKFDSGGATKYGISLAWAKQIGLDLDHDGDTDAADIMLLTPNEATKLYEKHFYYEPGIYRLPALIREAVMDFAVHSGAYRALFVLQGIANDHSADVFRPLVQDGVIGPKTLRELDRVLGSMGVDLFLITYIDRRQVFLDGLVERKPSQARFAEGWTNRLNKLRRLFNLPIPRS